ncbi:phasin family protein [Neosynechococcus sphagnicola]|nr:hypothetical protein [Neosynechococcus sphagnicola]
MGLGDIVQKAFYLGVGLAALGAEKAGDKLAEVRMQSQKLVDEMVRRGEMTTEEARRLVEELMLQAQQQAGSPEPTATATEPRKIEILSDTEGLDNQDLDKLRQQVQELQDELKQLHRD